MIRTLHRAKGGAQQLGALRPGEAGPFGRRPDEDDDQDQDDEQGGRPQAA